MKCAICNKDFKCITHKHLKHHNITVDDYKTKYGATFDSLFSQEMSMARKDKINIGDKNAAKRPEVKAKISNEITLRWDEDRYNDRINGMAGKIAEQNHHWKEENHTPLYLAEHEYVCFLEKFDNISECVHCHRDDIKINIHHIDENHKNFLPSNLEPLCVSCHANFHYSRSKLQFISVAKIFTFAAAHRLPNYSGPCENWHGHEWKLILGLKKRIDKETGMVLDFNIIKKIVSDHILSKFDHAVINDFIENPTAENMLVWIWEKLMFDGHLKGIDFIELHETPTSIARIDIKGMLSIFSDNIENYFLSECKRRSK